MGTKDFNIIDTMIASLRLREVSSYIEKKDRVLDFGCGHQAYFLNHIKKRIESGKGIDYDCPDKIIGNIRLINHTFSEKLPFKNKEFTKIFMLAVLEHIPIKNVKPLFMEFKRILIPGGYIILTTPTPKSKQLLEFLAFKLHIISDVEIKDHKKYYEKKDIYNILLGSGLKIYKYKHFEIGMNSLCIIKKI